MEVLAELVARITADTAELKKSLSQSEKDIHSLGKTVDKETKSIRDSFMEVGKAAGLMGAAITASMGAMILSFSKTGSELNDLSLKTGVSVEALAGLKYAAEQNGASLGTVEMAIRRTAMAMTDANEGLSETKRAFDRMGLSLQDIEGLNPEQQFLKIASAIAEISNPMTRAATAQDLFGRSGMDMLPMLAQGADGLKKMMTEGIGYNKWSTEAAKKADELGDKLHDLKESFIGITNTIASSVAPAITDLTKWFTDINKEVANIIKSQPELAKALGGGALAAGALAVAVGIAAGAMALLGAAFLPVLIGITFVGLLTAAGIALYDTFVKVDDKTKDLTKSTKELTKAWEAEQAQIKATSKKIKDSAIRESDKFGAEIIKAIQKKNQAEEKAELAKNKTLIDDNQEKTDSIVKQLEYETAQDIKAQKTMLDAATNRIDKEIDKERTRHTQFIDDLREEEKERLRTLDNNTKSVIKGIDSEIKAIQDAQKTDDKRTQQAQDNARRTQLEREISLADWYRNYEKATQLRKELADFEASLLERSKKESRQSEIDKLQDKKTSIQESATIAADAIRDEIDKRKKAEITKSEAIMEGFKNERKQREANFKTITENLQNTTDYTIEWLNSEYKTKNTYLESERAAIQAHYDELNTQEQLEADARSLILDNNQVALIELLARYNPEWQNAGQTFGQKLLDGLNSMKIPLQSAIADILALVGRANIPIPSTPAPLPGGAAGHGIRGYASGGIVPGPIGTPQLAMVHGGETILPPESSGGVVVNFTQPVFFEREDQMNKFVDMIRRGIQRQDRIRFGGAYSG